MLAKDGSAAFPRERESDRTAAKASLAACRIVMLTRVRARRWLILRQNDKRSVARVSRLVDTALGRTKLPVDKTISTNVLETSASAASLVAGALKRREEGPYKKVVGSGLGLRTHIPDPSARGATGPRRLSVTAPAVLPAVAWLVRVRAAFSSPSSAWGWLPAA